jgi:hypothetical protein
MTPEKFKRKLAAILGADVKGYSRLKPFPAFFSPGSIKTRYTRTFQLFGGF